MRAFALACLAAAVLIAAPAQAENRVFVIANNADGYGVDRCLASGASCGTAVASAYCRAQDFDRALSFRKIERGEISTLASATTCRGNCDGFVAIECGR
jgi:glyceraldehyde-3-phosphate dehydrogenase/erythrose-4-phosphate dehydrogenase